jgi:hypothetical protein
MTDDTVYRGVVQQLSVDIALSTYQTGKNMGGEDTDGQHDTLSGPADSRTYQLGLITGGTVPDKTEYFCTIIL